MDSSDTHSPAAIEIRSVALFAMCIVTLHLSEFIFLCIAVYNKSITTSGFSKVLPNFADELLAVSLQISVYGSSGSAVIYLMF